MIFVLQIFGSQGIDEAMLRISQADDLSSVRAEMDFLYRSLQNKLFRYFRKIFRKFIPPRTIEDLEDGYSEGWERLLIKRKTYNPNRPEGALSWIKVVIGNKIRNCFTRTHNHNKNNIKLYLPVFGDGEISENSKPTIVDIVAIENNTPVRTLYRNEIEQFINLFLEHDGYVSQNEKVRKVFELRFFEKKSGQEIKNELGIADSTITKYYQNTMYRLQAFLKHNGWDLSYGN